MSTVSSPSRADNSQGLAFGEFFFHHGWLSPGVRLFRRIGFRAKASWVALAIVLSLARLLQFVWADATEQISFATSERQGLTCLRPVLDLLHEARSRCRAATGQAAELPELQDKVKDAFQQVRANQTGLGPGYGTEKRFAALASAHTALRQARALATTSPTPRGNDEAAQLMLTLRSMRLNSRRLSATVLESSAQVQNSGQEISASPYDLSQRTEQAAANQEETAAREVKTRITTDPSQVEGGIKIVADAGATMRDVTMNADKMAGLMGEISTATREHAAAAASALTDQPRGLAVELNIFRLPMQSA
jgi:hypothetical protein